MKIRALLNTTNGYYTATSTQVHTSANYTARPNDSIANCDHVCAVLCSLARVCVRIYSACSCVCVYIIY